MEDPTGLFFTDQSSTAMVEAILRFESMEAEFCPRTIREIRCSLTAKSLRTRWRTSFVVRSQSSGNATTIFLGRFRKLRNPIPSRASLREPYELAKLACGGHAQTLLRITSAEENPPWYDSRPRRIVSVPPYFSFLWLSALISGKPGLKCAAS